MPQRPAIVDDDTLASWRTRPTKIALIDTGVSLEDPVIRGHMGRFAGKSWVDENENDYNDVCGHGTHLARLILKVSSTAHILVAKVSRDKKFTAASVINIVEVKWSAQALAVSLRVSQKKKKHKSLDTDVPITLGHPLGRPRTSQHHFALPRIPSRDPRNPRSSSRGDTSPRSETIAHRRGCRRRQLGGPSADRLPSERASRHLHQCPGRGG